LLIKQQQNINDKSGRTSEAATVFLKNISCESNSAIVLQAHYRTN